MCGPGRRHRLVEHVEVAAECGFPAPDEERPAIPGHHRRRQEQLNPVRHLRYHNVIETGKGAAHVEHQHRQCQHQPDPEPAGHIREFFRGAIIQTDFLRFQSHAKEGTVAASLRFKSGCQ